MAAYRCPSKQGFLSWWMLQSQQQQPVAAIEGFQKPNCINGTAFYSQAGT
jgi:hypothetical protein